MAKGEATQGAVFACDGEACRSLTPSDSGLIKAVSRAFGPLSLSRTEIKAWEPRLNQIIAYETACRTRWSAALERKIGLLEAEREELIQASRKGRMDRGLLAGRVSPAHRELERMRRALAHVQGNGWRTGQRLFQFINAAGDLAWRFPDASARARRIMLKLAVKEIRVGKNGLNVRLAHPFDLLANRNQPGSGASLPKVARLREVLIDALWQPIAKMRKPALFSDRIVGT